MHVTRSWEKRTLKVDGRALDLAGSGALCWTYYVCQGNSCSAPAPRESWQETGSIVRINWVRKQAHLPKPWGRSWKRWEVPWWRLPEKPG